MKNKSVSIVIAIVGLLALLLNTNGNSNAQTNMPRDSAGITTAPSNPQADSLKMDNDSALDKIAFSDSEKIVKWKHSREFSYIHYMDSLLRKEKDIKSDTVSLDRETGTIKRNRGPRKDNSYVNRLLNSLPFKIFFWLLALVFVIFISYNILFKNGIFSRNKNKLNTGSLQDSVQELNETSQYDGLIKSAEDIGDFNLATRYLFLKTLKLLSERDMIHFAPEKTNHEYLQEMKSNKDYNLFASLIRNYEYVWYGKFLIGACAYQNLKGEYQLFSKKV